MQAGVRACCDGMHMSPKQQYCATADHLCIATKSRSNDSVISRQV